MAHIGFYFNMDACVGCRTCQVACKDKNDLDIGVIYRRVDTYETGTFPSAMAYHLSHSCNHCERPACMANCSVGAITIDEDDGTVVIDQELCIGCESCIEACPYGVPQYIPELKVAGKCDGCIELRRNGEQPACASSCPLRALEFGDIEELRAAHPDAVDAIAVLPDPSQTNPSVAITPKPAALEDAFTPVIV